MTLRIINIQQTFLFQFNKNNSATSTRSLSYFLKTKRDYRSFPPFPPAEPVPPPSPPILWLPIISDPVINSSMNNTKGIFKSSKHIREDTETKKVQLHLHSSHHLIDSDEEERADPPPPNPREPDRAKRSKTGGSNKSIKFSAEVEQAQTGTSNRGCLKNGSDRRIQITGEDEDDLRSSKSIKFNTKNNDVFVYSLETKEKKKKTLSGHSSKQKQPVEGECCEIF